MATKEEIQDLNAAFFYELTRERTLEEKAESEESIAKIRKFTWEQLGRTNEERVQNALKGLRFIRSPEGHAAYQKISAWIAEGCPPASEIRE